MSVAARTGGRPRTTPFGLLGDERLARLAAAGHDSAFAVVYERHHQALYRYCRSILRHDADAQDALQSTFAAAFAALRRGRPDAPIRPWLFRIAHNEAVSTLRRRRPAADLSAAASCCTMSVEDQVEERAELDVLFRDLRELNERQRSALVMRELSGLSHEEIAIALDTSVGAAKQTIYEARRSLFEFSEGRAMPCDEIRRSISDADGRFLRSRRVRAHLRECSGCAAFATAIPARRLELSALAPPLPGLAAAGLLGRMAGAGATHGGGSALAGLAAGVAGKTAGAAIAANALAGIALVATATIGVTIGVERLAHGTRATHSAPPAARSTTGPGRTPAGATLMRPAGRVSETLPRVVRSSPAPSGAAPARAGGRRSIPAASSTGGRPSPAPARSAQPSAGAPGAAGSVAGGSAGTGQGASGTAQLGAVPGRHRASRPGAGAAKPHSGNGPPPWAGSGKPSTAGSGKPSTAGSGKPASAGNGPPPWAPAGGPPANPGGTSAAAPAATPPHPVPAGPPAGTPGAANSAGHAHAH